ncbi:hypothetical protein QYF61_016711 [Mycteria americana]|uniref:Uncharacterized protein n=1 Tax=Mycteria americana TaxID=33587 RepID=A0AAN7RQT9_MYCAM|nr:hypothetical protein QYF61_016711 [Mycteria americana]
MQKTMVRQVVLMQPMEDPMLQKECYMMLGLHSEALNKPNFLSLSSQERCSSPLIIFMSLLWTCSDRSMSSCAEGPRPRGSTPAQDMIAFLSCKCTLLAHFQFSIHQYPQDLLCRAALNPFIPQSVLILGIAPPQLQDLALSLVERHDVHMGPLLKPVKVPLDLRHQNQSSVMHTGSALNTAGHQSTPTAMGRDIFHQIRLPKAPSNLTLNAQGWGIHSFSGQPVPALKPLPLVVSPQALVKPPFIILKGHNKVSLEPPLLQAEQPQFSLTFFIGEVFQPLLNFMMFTWAHSSSLSKSLWYGIPSLMCISYATQLGVTCRAAEGALSPTAYGSALVCVG